MRRFNLLYAVFAIFVCSGLCDSDVSYSTENAFLQAYLDALSASDYDPRVPPDGNNGEGSPVEVFMSMHILNIHRIDDFNMDYRAQFYFRQSWNDSRLQFSDQDLSFINMRDVEKIWKPDLFFVEEKEGIMHNVVSPNIFVRIKPNGEVLCSVRLSITFSCPMDFRKYPHDTQKCTFNIESYGYQRSHIELDWDRRKPHFMSVNNNIGFQDFEIIDVKPGAKREVYLSGEYSSLQVTLTFQRKSGFFVTRLYIPFIILVLLAWLSFWIKPKAMTLRLTFLLVILYFMVTLGSEVNDYIPPAPYTKGSDVWIAVCESLVFAAFLELIAVSLISQKEEKSAERKFVKDPEISPELNLKTKKTTVNTDDVNSVVNFLTNRFTNEAKLSIRIDKIWRILYPVCFLFFNIVYWSVYCN